MIKVDKDKLEQVILNEMSDFEFNNFSRSEVCIGETDGYQIILTLERDEFDQIEEPTDKYICINETA